VRKVPMLDTWNGYTHQEKKGKMPGHESEVTTIFDIYVV
jgi:hypothetical protein